MWFIFGEHIARGSLYFDYLIFYKSVKNGVNYKTKTLQNISKFYWSLGNNRPVTFLGNKPSSKTCSKPHVSKSNLLPQKNFLLGRDLHSDKKTSR